MALDPAPFGRWTLRDKTAQRRSARRWASLVADLLVFSLFFLAFNTANQHMDS
jgi:hypothetical protein